MFSFVAKIRLGQRDDNEDEINGIMPCLRKGRVGEWGEKTITALWGLKKKRKKECLEENERFIITHLYGLKKNQTIKQTRI